MSEQRTPLWFSQDLLYIDKLIMGLCQNIKNSKKSGGLKKDEPKDLTKTEKKILLNKDNG